MKIPEKNLLYLYNRLAVTVTSPRDISYYATLNSAMTLKQLN